MMSNFKGPIIELPFVSVDNFEEKNGNFNSTCFFLTHCHSDHMQGLTWDETKEYKFIKFMASNPTYSLYCSVITKLILSTFPEMTPIMNQVKALVIGENRVHHIIVYEQDGENMSYELNVTLIPAAHCPGSVMFLFESLQNTILYTGDFRIVIGDIKKFPEFRSGLRLKVIDKIYLDGTFFHESYWAFPQRRDSIDLIIDRIKHWLTVDNHHVVFKMPANYGGEYILQRVSEELNYLIHVESKFYHMYMKVPEINHIFTDQCSKTRIHSQNRHYVPKCNIPQENILIIEPKALSFHCEKYKQPVKMREKKFNVIEVNYSSHSSYSEIEDFLCCLKPKAIHICTRPFSKQFQTERENLIEWLLESWKTSAESPEPKRQKRKTSTPVSLCAVKIIVPQSSITEDQLQLSP